MTYPTSKINTHHLFQEACDPVTVSQCICDLKATFDHILEVQRTISKSDFENYVRNVTCYRYKRTPEYFLLLHRKRGLYKKRQNPSFENIYSVTEVEQDNSKATKSSLKWNWIRNKRSLLSFNDDKHVHDEDFEITDDSNDLDQDNNIDGNTKLDESRDDELYWDKIEKSSIQFDVDDDFYEKYYKGDDNVYRRKKKRRKRTAVDMKELVLGLMNLPTLEPGLVRTVIYYN